MTREDLEAAVEEALWGYHPIRASLSHLRVTVSSDGRVEVSGPVRSGLLKDGVLESVRWVSGVTGIVDGIVADSELEIAVATALATDPGLKDLPPGAIAVHSHLGEITLTGNVGDPSLSAIAVKAASQVNGVLAVHDRTG